MSAIILILRKTLKYLLVITNMPAYSSLCPKLKCIEKKIVGDLDILPREPTSMGYLLEIWKFVRRPITLVETKIENFNSQRNIVKKNLAIFVLIFFM